MCLNTSQVIRPRQWNWSGDVIVANTVVRAMRLSPYLKTRYDVDIRDYLGIENNAVLKKTIGEILSHLTPSEKELFTSKRPGSFDFRALRVLAYMEENIHCETRDRRFDWWLFPEETLHEKTGDCEDRAFLLGALLLAVGISPYSVRVVLGSLYNHLDENQETKLKDHVWVMYQNEIGNWVLLEPLNMTPTASFETTAIKGNVSPNEVMVEYVPYFVFNNHHLWYIYNKDEFVSFEEFCRQRRRFWYEYDPSFSIQVHSDILTQALKDKLTDSALRAVLRQNMLIDTTGSIFTFYNPFQHFDNGYIREGWGFIQEQKNAGNLTSFVKAAHAIADFYAHSSYGIFANHGETEFTLFDGNPDPTNHAFPNTPDYSKNPLNMMDSNRFSVNTYLTKSKTRDEVVSTLNSKGIISGRFAQPHDSQSLLEYPVYIPQKLRAGTDFEWRGCLPHHNEIAMDDPLTSSHTIPGKHKLYTSADDYSKQFDLRKNTALSHISQIYEEMGNPS